MQVYLGVLFDKTLTMEKQVSSVSKSCFLQIRKIGRVCELLYRYIMFGRGICEKYQSRDEQFPEPNCEGILS